MKIDGSCHCGYITYSAEVDPERTSICHCTDCQALSGTAFRLSIPAPDHAFRVLTGEPTVYIKTAESGNKRAHGFCGDCGSPIYSSKVSDPPMYSLRVGCLDQRAQLPPAKQIWCRSSLAWAMNIEGIPKVERQ